MQNPYLRPPGETFSQYLARLCAEDIGCYLDEDFIAEESATLDLLGDADPDALVEAIWSEMPIAHLDKMLDGPDWASNFDDFGDFGSDYDEPIDTIEDVREAAREIARDALSDDDGPCRAELIGLVEVHSPGILRRVARTFGLS